MIGAFDAGDELPQLVAVRAYRLLPGDAVWGVSAENPRKGFLVDAEPYTVAGHPVEDGNGWVSVRSAGGATRRYRRETLTLVKVRRGKS